MIKRILISILFRLLGYERPKDFEDKRINEWLARMRSDMGFRQYLSRRESSILRSFGVAINPRTYDILSGQRLEITSLINAAEKAWQIENKNKLINKARLKKDNFFESAKKTEHE